ncbi:MAG: C25 family cysteine peptidase [candidate division WOR-3 bacterium]
MIKIKMLTLLLILPSFIFSLHITVPVDQLNYTISDFEGYKKICLENGVTVGNPGSPEIPSFVYTLFLPTNQKIKYVNIAAAEWEEIAGEYLLFPVQPPALLNGPLKFFGPDSEIYQCPGFYPENLVIAFHSGNLRGYHLGQILIAPFRYEPITKKLYVLRKLVLDIETEPYAGGIKPYRQTRFSQKIFENILQTMFQFKFLGGTIHHPEVSIEDNTEDLLPSDLPSFSGTPLDLIIVTTEPFVPVYEEFLRYKKLFGFNGVIKTMEWIRNHYLGVDDAEKLRNFIREAVEKWGVSFVLLGNDVPDIPTRWVWVDYVMGSYPAHFTTDLYYSDLDGNWNFDGDEQFGEVSDSIDLYPDVFVGRIPAHVPDDVAHYLNKTLSYLFALQSPPNSNESWQRQALFVTSMFWSQNDSYYLARNQLSPLLPGNFGRNFFNESSKQQILRGIKEGYNLITWLAHGDVNLLRARTNPREYVSNFDFDSLANNIYPFMVVISCFTGPFQEDCLGEHWVMNPHGGGIGYIGPTSSSAAYNHIDYIRTLFPHLFSELLSVSLAFSKIPWIVYAQFDNWHRVFQYSLNLLGDPTLKLWEVVPHRIDSVLVDPDTLNVGYDTLTLHIYPMIERFEVVYYKENEVFLKDSGFVGIAVTPLRTRSTGFLKYTIIADGCVPYIDSLYVLPLSGYLVYQGQRVVDTLGNGDGIPNPGEIIDLFIGLRNTGTQPLDSVFLRIASLDSFVTILVDTARYGVIMPGGVEENLTPLRIAIGPWTPDGYEVYLALDIGGFYSDSCSFTVEAPVLRLFTQDYILDGGVYKVLPVVENCGSGDADSVYALVRSYSDTVVVLDSLVYFGAVSSGHVVSARDTFRLMLNYPGRVVYSFALYSRGWQVEERQVVLGRPMRVDSLWAFGTPNSVVLNWVMVSGAVGYRIYRALEPNGDFEYIGNPLTRVSYYEDLGVELGRDYYYYVVAVDSSLNQGYASDTIKARVNPAVALGWPRMVFGYLFSSPNFGDLDPDYPGLEVVVSSRNGDVYIWHCDGTPVGIDPYGRIFSCNSEIWSSPAVGDVDRDGNLEICFGIRRWGENLYILRRSGISWVPMDNWPKSLDGSIIGSPVLADIDNDGDLEVFVITEAGRFYVFHHTGEGVYSPDGILKVLYGWHGGSPAVGDLNNDGDLEIVACGGSQSDSLFIWDRHGNYFGVFPKQVAAKMCYSPVLGDVIGDGSLEICFYTDSTDMVHLLDMNGNLVWQRYIPALGDVEGYPVLANVVGDGRPEVVVGSNRGSMFLSVLDSLGNIVSGFPVSLGWEFKLPVVGDVDGDGMMDLVCGAGDWNLYAFHNNGGLVSGYPIHFGIRIEQSPALYDIDQDGKLELMIGANDYRFWVFDLDGQFFEWPKFRYDPYNSGCYKSLYWANVGEVVTKSGGDRFYFGVYPNPFKNRCVIRLKIPSSKLVGQNREAVKDFSLVVYDVLGRQVRMFNLDPARLDQISDIIWDGSDNLGRKLPSGIYFVRLKVGQLNAIRKAILLNH